MARSPAGLPRTFDDPGVRVAAGNVTDSAAVAAAVERAGRVVHLAHGGGGTWEEIQRTMVGGARLVGEHCARAKRPLVFTSSIAALHLGDPAAVVRADTPADPHPERRADYARGKVASEAEIRRLVAEAGLEAVIVRPGVVVGEGTSPFHSGVGQFNRETHCIGWNAGRNPLPLVLVEDVAAAIATLCRGEGWDLEAGNLVGDVRLAARDYIAALAAATGRPLRFRPERTRWLAAVEAGKWAIKRVGGRRAARTTLYDLRSRGLAAAFDTTLEKDRLGWRPEADRARFLARAFAGVTGGGTR
jgi:nucleoside-diphosphate-sugar epimerase